jgi:hypothetical protein
MTNMPTPAGRDNFHNNLPMLSSASICCRSLFMQALTPLAKQRSRRAGWEVYSLRVLGFENIE